MMNKEAILDALNTQLSLNKDSKILVVGLGKTGFSVAKFLHQQGIPFAVIDSRDKPPLNDELLTQYPDTPVFTGGFDEAAFCVATHLVVSPGVSLKEQSIQKAMLSGVKLISDIDLFACSTTTNIIAITGSNGKSTVTTMLGDMGNASHIKTAIGGNLGEPALDLLDESIELYVIELSSFQLERTSKLNAIVATVLNISADHMDRHDGIEGYAKEKQQVFSGQGCMVLNADDDLVKAMAEKNRQVIYFSTKQKADFYLGTYQSENWLMHKEMALISQADLNTEGTHNIANALAALAIGIVINLDMTVMCDALRRFKGLNHRMQKVAIVNDVAWINDSKATNVGACIAALQGYKKPVILIAGGDAKGAEMDQLTPVIGKKTKCVILLGKDADKIENAINGCVPTYRVNSMHEAVNMAAINAEAGESVLLSPACASIDQYKSYQERGDKFTRAVLALAK